MSIFNAEGLEWATDIKEGNLMKNEVRLTGGEFRSLLNLMMCSDPWVNSVKEFELLLNLITVESQLRGYTGWVDAYHEVPEVA